MKRPNLLHRGRRTSFEDMSQSFSDARRRIGNGEQLHFVSGTNEDSEVFPDEELSSSDAISILTDSTMATMDDNIGTGRTVDKFFFQPAGKFVERFLVNLTKSRSATGWVPPIRPTNIDSSDDSCSMSTTSTDTATDLPGPGRLFDKYVYQVTGKLLEHCAGRIATKTFLSADAISARIVEIWQLCYTEGLCDTCLSGAEALPDADKVQHAIGHIETVRHGSFILAGIKELINRTR